MDEKSKISTENNEKLHKKVYERLYNQAKENRGSKKLEDEKWFSLQNVWINSNYIEREASEYSFKPQLISEPIVCSDLPFLERMEKLQKIREEK